MPKSHFSTPYIIEAFEVLIVISLSDIRRNVAIGNFQIPSAFDIHRSDFQGLSPILRYAEPPTLGTTVHGNRW